MNDINNDIKQEKKEDWFREHAQRNHDYFRKHGRKNRRLGGLFLLAVGAVLMMRESGVEFPFWFFSWPMILIAIGLFSGIRHGFKSSGWIIMLLVGGAFLADEILIGSNLKHFLWPAFFVMLGLFMILRPRRNCRDDDYRYGRNWRRNREETSYGTTSTAPGSGAPASETKYSDRSDYIDSTAIFGGVEKIVLSKNFKGGDITSIFGGTELNLLQADITGPVVIDTTNILGGTKLIVPASWDVQSEVVAIFGGIEDKRQTSNLPMDPNKVLILKGTCFMGGIDIRSYA